MRNKIAMFFLFVVILSLSAFNLTGSQKFIIYDEAVTTSNDTLVSEWVSIGSSQNVAIFYNTDDTSYVKGSFEYRYGSVTSVNSLTADTLSLDTRGSALTGISKGKVLRGYGLTADLIPGANAVRVTMIWKAGSEATTAVKVGIIYE